MSGTGSFAKYNKTLGGIIIISRSIIQFKYIYMHKCYVIIDYFSVAVIKNHDQKNSSKDDLLGNYWFQRVRNPDSGGEAARAGS